MGILALWMNITPQRHAPSVSLELCSTGLARSLMRRSWLSAWMVRSSAFTLGAQREGWNTPPEEEMRMRPQISLCLEHQSFSRRTTSLFLPSAEMLITQGTTLRKNFQSWHQNGSPRLHSRRMGFVAARPIYKSIIRTWSKFWVLKTPTFLKLLPKRALFN